MLLLSFKLFKQFDVGTRTVPFFSTNLYGTATVHRGIKGVGCISSDQSDTN
jgi:hypothetical protein